METVGLLDLPPSVVTPEDLLTIPGADLAFVEWARRILPTGRLDTAVKLLIQSGKALDIQQALTLLTERVKVDGRPSMIFWNDVTGREDSRVWQKLADLLSVPTSAGRETQPGPLTYRYGVLSHQAAYAALRGLYADSQLHLFEPEDLSGEPWLGLKIERPSFPEDYDPTSRITRLWGEIWDKIKGKRWWEQYHAAEPFMFELSEALRPIYQHYVDILLGRAREEADPLLKLYTLLEWAALAIHATAKPRRIFFTEVPVLDRELGLSGGRPDAVEVVSVDGHPPTRRQRQVLFSLARKRFRSVGHLVAILNRTLSAIVQLRIVDFKFAVGDGPGGRILGREECEHAALREHVQQLERYITLSELDLAICCGEPEKLWTSEPYLQDGRLLYVLPVGLPIVQRRKMTAEQQREVFAEIAGRYHLATHRATLRYIGREVRRQVRIHVRGQENGPLPTNGNNHKNEENGTLAPIVKPPTKRPVMEDIIRRHTAYADRFQAIRVAGKTRRGDPRLAMDLGRLLEVIEDGLTKVERWSIESGGALSCIMNAHTTDPGPSLTIFLVRDAKTGKDASHFYCFGCRAHGYIDPATIPVEIAGKLRLSIRSQRALDSKITIPDEHHRILSFAQELLQRRFPGSKGEGYLAEKRLLDSGLAHRFGAGYWDEAIIHQLLDAGFTFQDLVNSGLIRYSLGIKEHRSLLPLLRSRGLPDKELIFQTTKDGRNVVYLPRSEMTDRVTFPLEYLQPQGGPARLVNFYGRHTWTKSSRFAHSKLTSQRTGLPQGMFNPLALREQDAEVLVAESVIDALTLMQLGYSAVSFVGTGDYASQRVLGWEAIANGLSIGIAFDNDESGYEAANGTIVEPGKLEKIGVIGWLRERGVKDVYNFTARFVEERPHVSGTDDFNSMWRKAKKGEIPPI